MNYIVVWPENSARPAPWMASQPPRGLFTIG